MDMGRDARQGYKPTVVGGMLKALLFVKSVW